MAEINQLINSFTATQVVDDGSVLSFEGRQLKLNTAEDAEPVAKEIENSTSLKVLVLKGNTINFPAAERIAESLKKCKNLQRALWSDMFTGRTKAETPPSLKFFSSALMTAQVSLTELDLSDNAFGPAGAEAIKDLLRSSVCYSLEVLKLNNDGLGIGGGQIIARALTDCWNAGKGVGKPLKLKVFVAGRNRLENQGAEALAEAFEKIGTLEEITMPQNGIYHRGITALAKAAAANPNLIRLNLSDNTFTAKGAHAMSAVLPKLTKLEIINFSDCILRSQGAFMLAKVLKTDCANLKELLVSGNELNKDAAYALAVAVINKKSFEKLELACNNIGETGIEEIENLFKTKNASQCLGSFSDDEGTPDEEEEVEEEEEEEEGDEDEEEDDEDWEDDEEEVQNDEFHPSDSFTRSDDILLSQESSYEKAARFLRHFDGKTLCELGNEAPDLILEQLTPNLYDPHVAVDILCSVSSLITPGAKSDVKQNALLVCRKLLSYCFAHCDVPLFTDFLAAKLGVIKSEDKKVASSIYGLIFVLEQECGQVYFSKTTKDVLKFLVEKHLSKLIQSEKTLWTKFLDALCA